MALKIRLSRGGSKKRPYYHIVIADARAPRDGRYIERVGHYNPMLPKDNAERMKVNAERVTHWIKMGAKPTERVQRFLGTLGLYEKYVPNAQTKKHLPGIKAQEKLAEDAKAAAAKAEEAKAAKEKPAEEAPAEEAVAETPAEEVVEAPAEEAVAEAPAEEVVDAPAETPAEEAPTEEAPAEETKAE